MNDAYVVGHITVKNIVKWAEYRSQVRHPDIVVIRFPNIAAVNGWYTSPAYQALIPLRQQAADIVLLSYVA